MNPVKCLSVRFRNPENKSPLESIDLCQYNIRINKTLFTLRYTASYMYSILPRERAVPKLIRRLVAGFPQRRPGFEPRLGHVGFVAADKVALGQVFSEYFSFPCQFSFHRVLHTHRLSSGAGTIGQNSGRRTKRTVSPHLK
jgi:hypothetical protein